MSLLASLALAGCAGPGTKDPDPGMWSASCPQDKFSFVVFSDNYGGQESGLRRVLKDAVERNSDVRFLISAGDTPTFQRVRGVIDDQLDDIRPCGARSYPWFPAMGNHDIELPQNMSWWENNWAIAWESAPAKSQLASQLPGLRNFRRGPLQVRRIDGHLNVSAGTIYSFDYQNSHFIFLNVYEQGIPRDPAAGVWDYNGSLYDPATSQLDWLKEDLKLNSQPFVFVIGHVAALTPCYNKEPPNPYYHCPGPPPPGWSDHNHSFHTEELTKLLAEHNVMAYFHGHDHVPSRMLVNPDRTAAYQRLYWDVRNDPAKSYGNPDDWQSLQGPGRFWQVDAGLVYTRLATYVLVSVTDASITFELYRYQGSTQEPIELWDSWTVPTAGYCNAEGCRSTATP